MVSSAILILPPQFGGRQCGRLLEAISVLRAAALGMASGCITLNSHKKCHSIAPAVPSHAGKYFPLPSNREFGSNRDRGIDSNADPGGRRVLDSGRSKMRCSGLIFPANLSDRHHVHS
jgi:hypothetical protein